MPKSKRRPPAGEGDKQERLKSTREQLESAGVAEDTVPDPLPAADARDDQARPAGEPDQGSVQPAAATVKEGLHRRR